MDKIKAINPKIVANSDADKPYYSIEYYDTADNKWHIGYGSYELKNVIEWIKTNFDVIEADVAPVRHGHWVKEKKDALIHWHCSACKECYFLEEPNAKYCPNCGAKMDKQ
ncbi:MAG: hypothetical protein ACI4I1_07455 [Oscillospiraceae bacterium]